MNGIDSTVTVFLNGYAHKSFFFDSLMQFIMESHLLKGGLFMALLWWVWVKDVGNEQMAVRSRGIVLATIVGTLFAIVIAKTVEHGLPFHARPMNNSNLHFQLPYSIPNFIENMWSGHSSFPSDHAAMFFALATGLLFVSRKLGILALGYVLLFIAFPRVYNGLHYLSDILGGAVIGAGASYLSNISSRMKQLAQLILRWEERSAALFNFCLFIFIFQAATLFEDTRALGKLILILTGVGR